MAVSSNGGVVVESGSEKGMFSSLSFSFLLSCICTHNNPTFSLRAMKRMQHNSFNQKGRRMSLYLLNDGLPSI